MPEEMCARGPLLETGMTNKASEHTTNGGGKKVTSVRGGTFEHSIASIICQVKFSTYENASILTINNGCSSSLGHASRLH
jgi:hypothetical protein